MEYDEMLTACVYTGMLKALRQHRREVIQERSQKPQCLALAKKTNKQCTLSVDDESDYCYLHKHYGERANS